MQLTRLSTLMPIGLIKLMKPLAMPIIVPKMRRFFSMFIREGDLVFDVGAHEGELASVFLSLGAEVVCVEPNPECVRILEKRFSGERSVRIVQKGLGKEEGKLMFSINDSSSTISTFSEKWKTGRYRDEKWGRQIEASVTTMDSLMAEFGKPRFCKIDVEGFELQVLEGMGSAVPALSFEFTKEFLEDARACAERLSSIGMGRFNYSPYSESSLSLEGWAGTDSLMERLSAEKDQRLWGDIYAISDKAKPP